MAALFSSPTPIPIHLYRKILHELWVRLPQDHKTVFDAFLNLCTAQEIHAMKARFCALASDRFDTLAARFGNASDDRLWNYLLVSIEGAPRVDDGPIQSEYTYCIGSEDKKPKNGDTGANEKALLDGKVFDVPQEIHDMLVEDLFKAIYLPGTVVADQYPVFDGRDCFANVGFPLGKSKVLRRVHSKLYERYKEAYWTHNTWEIKEGVLSYTMDFLQHLPAENYLKIRSLAISFAMHDSDKAYWYCRLYNDGQDLLDNLDTYDDECRTVTNDQHDVWFWKFYHISGLRLQSLTLDFTNTFSPEGEFLGVETVADFGKFDHGMPNLTILAPTVELEQQIYEVFKVKNSS